MPTRWQRAGCRPQRDIEAATARSSCATCTSHSRPPQLSPAVSVHCSSSGPGCWAIAVAAPIVPAPCTAPCVAPAAAARIMVGSACACSRGGWPHASRAHRCRLVTHDHASTMQSQQCNIQHQLLCSAAQPAASHTTITGMLRRVENGKENGNFENSPSLSSTCAAMP